MELYLLRHGQADPRAASEPDADRALTAKGARDVTLVLKAARRAMNPPQLILSSPLRRARETADVAAKSFPPCPLVVTDRLKPEADAGSIWKEACKNAEISRVLLVGHQPHLGHLLSFLLEGAVEVDFKKGTLIRVDTPRRLGAPRGVLRWLLTPKLVRGL